MELLTMTQKEHCLSFNQINAYLLFLIMRLLTAFVDLSVLHF